MKQKTKLLTNKRYSLPGSFTKNRTRARKRVSQVVSWAGRLRINGAALATVSLVVLLCGSVARAMSFEITRETSKAVGAVKSNSQLTAKRSYPRQSSSTQADAGPPTQTPSQGQSSSTPAGSMQAPSSVPQNQR